VPELRNPLEGDQRAIADGSRLFVSLNCADCHGGAGSGLVGPSFQDNRWRYGGSAGDVYRSIAEGRPEGMPVWNKILPPNEIWKLVAYVRTLGVGKDVTTQSFTGKGIERSGH
jgi:cytochrome c oxidase cbb3-type subunit 3